MNIKKYFVTIGTVCAALITAALLPSLAFASASFDTSLSYGSSGTAVVELQNFLISQKCLSVSATGYFGSLTIAGVKCFQEKHAITPTGYFGVLSRTAANSLVVNNGIYTPVSAATTATSSSAHYTGMQIQSSVNLSQGALAPASVTPLAGYGNTAYVQASTSPYSFSPLAGSEAVPVASTSMSQGVNATPSLSPLINTGSN